MAPRKRAIQYAASWPAHRALATTPEYWIVRLRFARTMTAGRGR